MGPWRGSHSLWSSILWTVWHLKTETIATIITCPISCANFRNRIELQNKFLSLAHASLYIPLTLNGSCLKGADKLNQKNLQENISSTTSFYISRVNGTPFWQNKLKFFLRLAVPSIKKKTILLRLFWKRIIRKKSFRRGTYWDVSVDREYLTTQQEKQVYKKAPTKYVFSLLGCCQSNCTHPFCKRGWSVVRTSWYRGGRTNTNLLSITVERSRSAIRSRKLLPMQIRVLRASSKIKLFRREANQRSTTTTISGHNQKLYILSVYKKYKNFSPDNVIHATLEA